MDVDPKTLGSYRGYLREHVGPVIGQVKIVRLDVEILESFYAELRRRRDH